MYFYDAEEMKNKLDEKGINIRELSRRVDLPYYTVYRVIKNRQDLDTVSLRIYKKIVNELWKGE